MAVDMNKTIAEASLDNLHDIIIPAEIGLFPLAQGWIIVLLLLLALLFHFLFQFYQNYKKFAYKREALKELAMYTSKDKEETIKLLSLAKRVGIVAYSRKTVAKFSSEQWWDFVEMHSEAKISPTLRDEIKELLYDEGYRLDTATYEAIKTFVSLWISTHKVSKDV